MKYIVMCVSIMMLGGCTLLLGDFTVEGDKDAGGQQCGPTTSVTGNCFANTDASTDD